MALRFRLFSRWGDFLYEPNVIAFDHTEEINGQDYITFTTDRPFAWGDRVLWEENGLWHEHVVNESTQAHRNGETYRVTAINSFMWDLSLRMVNKTRWNGANLQYAVTELLKLSPAWTVGTVKSTSAKNLEYERESCYDAILKTCGTFNCEILKEIEVDKTGVVKRTVSFVDHIGVQREGVHFEYGAGMTGVDKIIHSDAVITACYGFGSGIEDEELWCYISNDDALRYWGLPDGHGSVMHAEGIFTDPEIEDATTLRQKTTEYLNAHSAPTITYQTDIPFVALKDVTLGDSISLVDTEFTPEIRMYARIGSWNRTKVGNHLEANSVTFGQVISVVPDALGRANMQEKVIVRQNETIGNLKGDLKKAQSDLSSTRDSLAGAQNTIGQLQTDLKATELALSNANRELEQAKSDASAAKSQANSLATTVTQQGQTIKDLQSEVKALSDLWHNELELSMAYTNAYNATWGIGDIWLKARRGTALSSNDISVARNLYSTYQRSISGSGGAHRNESVEQMYNEIMLVADPGIEGPTIGDEQTGPELDTNQTDQDEPPKEE